MRHLLVLLIVGLVLAVSSPAWAVSIPFRQAYNGPVSFHLSDWDEGTQYTVAIDPLDGKPHGVYLNGSLAPLNTPISAALLKKTLPSKGMGGEDAWGIVRVESIYDASITGPNAMTIGGTILFAHGDSGVELVGLFSGRMDDTVTFYGTGMQEIYSDPLLYYGDRISLYIQPAGTAAVWATGMGGPGARLGSGDYPNIGTANLVLGGFIVPGFENTDFFGANGQDGVYTQFTPQGNSGSGTFDMYIKWDTGTDLALFTSTPGIFPFNGGPGIGYSADARLKGTITATSVPTNDPWLVSTSDPAYMSVIPEPVTMAGMLLGIGCLSRYIRKRR